MLIEPFNEEKVYENQPWLEAEENVAAQAFSELQDQRMLHLFGSVRPSLLTKYILTTDFRIVEEPDTMRWGIFLERGKHRVIDKTVIHEGVKERRSHAPSMKPEYIWVSTVFIGSCIEELFETMIFGGPLNTIRWKNKTLIDAKKCHWEAVSLAKQVLRYLKRHGKRHRKDWIRLERFWQLARKRGVGWAMKHVDRAQRIDDRLTRAPGCPPRPMGDWLAELASTTVSRPTLTKNPLLR